MSENSNVQMLVSGKIVSGGQSNTQEPDIEIEKGANESLDTFIDFAKQVMENKKVGAIKIDGLDTVKKIIIDAQTEGIIQATFTELTAEGVSIAAGTVTVAAVGLLGTGTIALATGAIAGTVMAQLVYNKLGPWLDERYDLFEEQLDIYLDNKYGKAIIDTTIPNYNTLKGIASPLYDSLQYLRGEEDQEYNSIEINVSPKNENDEPLIYTIKPGDTVWDLCQKYGVGYEDLFELNDWLRDRFSEDGKFALIRPGEKLRIPLNNKTELLEYNPTYNKWVEIAGDVAKIVDPMFLDLNGDGKMGTTSLENGINFDHAKDGFKELSAWVDKEDGILVIDKNENGIIDDGSEIFGDNYIKSNGNKAANGFEALTDLDSNKDGIINSSDKEFDKIKVLKGDGTLVSLTELGIVSISLNKTTVNEADENGNVLVYKGTYTKEDGTTGSLGTFNLIVDKMMSEEVNKVEVSEDVASLPNIKGYGTVHSLHQAMMLDETGELKAA